MPAQFTQTTRSLSGDTSRVSLVVWLVTTVLLGTWAVWFVTGRVTVYEVSQRARLEVRQSSSPVAAQVAGRVVSSTLALDAHVRAGDVLVRLDDATARKQLREATTRLAAVAPRMAALEREMAARQRERDADADSSRAAQDALTLREREAALAAEFARDYEKRTERLRTDGLLSQVDAGRAASEAARAAATRDSLGADAGRVALDARVRRGQLDAAIENLRQQVASLQGEAATAQAAIERLEAELETRVVRAPVDGRLGEVAALARGAYITEGQVLAAIVPDGELVAIAEFSPSLTLGRLREGQRGRIRLDGFPWGEYGTLPVTVTRVASEFRDQALRVELRLDAGVSAAPLQHGLPGAAEVAVEQVSPATLVMRAAGLWLEPQAQAATVQAAMPAGTVR